MIIVIIIIRRYVIEPWHVFVRETAMLVSTQDCSKGIRKSKSENFGRRPRSSAEGQGKSCPMGTVDGLSLGIVEVQGVSEKTQTLPVAVSGFLEMC